MLPPQSCLAIVTPCVEQLVEPIGCSPRVDAAAAQPQFHRKHGTARVQWLGPRMCQPIVDLQRSGIVAICLVQHDLASSLAAQRYSAAAAVIGCDVGAGSGAGAAGGGSTKDPT
jgi:hypothetical protein